MHNSATRPTNPPPEILSNFIIAVLRRKFYSLRDGRDLKTLADNQEYQNIKKAYIEALFIRMIGATGEKK